MTFSYLFVPVKTSLTRCNAQLRNTETCSAWTEQRRARLHSAPWTNPFCSGSLSFLLSQHIKVLLLFFLVFVVVFLTPGFVGKHQMWPAGQSVCQLQQLAVKWSKVLAQRLTADLLELGWAGLTARYASKNVRHSVDAADAVAATAVRQRVRHIEKGRIRLIRERSRSENTCVLLVISGDAVVTYMYCWYFCLV